MELQCVCVIDEIGGIFLVECKGQKEGKFRDWICDFTIMNKLIHIFWMVFWYWKQYDTDTSVLWNIAQVLIKRS